MKNNLAKVLEKCIQNEKSQGVSEEKINEEINIGLKNLIDLLNTNR